MRKKRTDRKKLDMWQRRLRVSETAYKDELEAMDTREVLYLGTNELHPITEGDKKKSTPHIRNICAELIESQVDSNIPQPKVTACRAEDEDKAKLIEDMLRNELDRMPFEQFNDMAERTVPIQGGTGFLVEWDNSLCTHTAIGDLAISVKHPKQIIPQDGVYTGIEDMDYIFLKIPQTKEYIRRRYGVDVSDETEKEPDVRSSDNETSAEDLVTQYIAYYRNDSGGIGLYSWVNDTQLEDMEDYQARRLRRCAQCGAIEPLTVDDTGEPAPNTPKTLEDLMIPPIEAAGAQIVPPITETELAAEEEHLKPMPRKRGRKACPYCGGEKWEESSEDYEEIYTPITRSDGSVIPGAQFREVISDTEVDEFGLPIVEVVEEPTRVPFYKPNIYPLILQKNVSVYGKFLGDSDIDKIATQQNTTNRIEAKIIDKLVKSGSYMTLPRRADIERDSEDVKVIYLENPAEKALIDVFDLQGNVEYDLVYLNQIYEEARQMIGITDSFQGRADRTATSGKAKEFAAAQSAGRLESKRVMKDAAYAALFETMFKFWLAYADEERPVISSNVNGDAEYKQLSRYDFLEQDAAGEWYWNDRFLFSCDTTAPLASNREAMWQETRMNLQTGAFGDPTNIQTLIMFWTKMKILHYPGAGDTLAQLQETAQQQETERQMAMQIQMRQAQMQAQAAMPQLKPIPPKAAGGTPGGTPPMI